jgi:hypothetical protein
MKEGDSRTFLKDIKLDFSKSSCSDIALLMNFKGETPVHLAVKSKNLDLLNIFAAKKHQSLTIKDI